MPGPLSPIETATPEELFARAAELQLEVIRVRSRSPTRRAAARADRLERHAAELRTLAEDRRRSGARFLALPGPNVSGLGDVGRDGPNTSEPGDVGREVDGGVAGTTWLSTAEAAERLGMARSTLDEMVAQAPQDLPGSPTQVGVGRRRRHLRWNAGGLEAWVRAYRAWQLLPARGRKQRVAAARRKRRSSSGGRPPSLLAVVTRDDPSSADPR
jgi:predicted DNA-binding transcriptional regulator AlpA